MWTTIDNAAIQAMAQKHNRLPAINSCTAPDNKGNIHVFGIFLPSNQPLTPPYSCCGLFTNEGIAQPVAGSVVREMGGSYSVCSVRCALEVCPTISELSTARCPGYYASNFIYVSKQLWLIWPRWQIGILSLSIGQIAWGTEAQSCGPTKNTKGWWFHHH